MEAPPEDRGAGEGEDRGEEEEEEDDHQPMAKLIRHSDLLDSAKLSQIWADLYQSYYVSTSWLPEFYSLLAYNGFISVSKAVPSPHDGQSVPLLIPEMQRAYGVLEPLGNLHVARKVFQRSGKYVLRFDTAFDETLQRLVSYHDDCWLLPEYQGLMRALHALGPYPVGQALMQVHSVELFDAATDELVAGELGYCIGRTYTSLTGFTDLTRKSAGKVQLAGLACVLENAGAALWNFGHPPRPATPQRPASMLYKAEMGVTVLPRQEFLQLWLPARDEPLLTLPQSPAVGPSGARSGPQAASAAGIPVRGLLERRTMALDPCS